MNKGTGAIGIVLAVIAIIIGGISLFLSLKQSGNESEVKGLLARVESLEKRIEELKVKEKEEENTNTQTESQVEKDVKEAFENLSKMYAQTPDVFLTNGQVILEKIQTKFNEEAKIKVYTTDNKGTFKFNVGTSGNIEVEFTPAVTNTVDKKEIFVVSLTGQSFVIKNKNEENNTNTNSNSSTTNSTSSTTSNGTTSTGTIEGSTLNNATNATNNRVQNTNTPSTTSIPTPNTSTTSTSPTTLPGL